MPNRNRMYQPTQTKGFYKTTDRYTTSVQRERSFPSSQQYPSPPPSIHNDYATSSIYRPPQEDDYIVQRGRKWPSLHEHSVDPIPSSMHRFPRVTPVSMVSEQVQPTSMGLPHIATLLKRCQTEDEESFQYRKCSRVEKEQPVVIPPLTSERSSAYEAFSRITPLLQPTRRDPTQYLSSNILPLVNPRQPVVMEETPSSALINRRRMESAPFPSSHPLPLNRYSPSSSTATTTSSSPCRSPLDDGELMIGAVADLVQERSPSQRESITKLLLKSKGFLNTNHLIRNRNNEIDWVATFLHVGFESNSIYSLMCPLRKGRWKMEEEKYTMELLRLIENKTIRLKHGQSIRNYIAKKLHSDDMRVLKKLSNCKLFHFVKNIHPRVIEEGKNGDEFDTSIFNAHENLKILEKRKCDFLRSVQLEALVAVRKYLTDSSIRELLNG